MKIDEDFVKGVAYYIGDGRMTSQRSLSTINQDAKVIRFFIKWLKKYFRIKKETLRIHIRTSQPNYSERELRKEFSKKLRLKEKYITSISLKHNSKPHHKTLVEVFANNTTAKKEFNNTIQTVKEKCLKNKWLAIAYLKGIMAAEGSAKHNIKSGSRSIHLKMKDEKEIKYIGGLLNDVLKIKSSILNVKSEEGMWLITISGFYELSNLNDLDLFEIESRKRTKLNRIIKSYKRVQTKKGYVKEFFIENLKNYNKKLKKNLTAPELAKLIGRDRTRTIYVLRKLEKEGLIKSKRRKSTGRPFEFWIMN